MPSGAQKRAASCMIRLRAGSGREGNIVFAGKAAHVDDGIAHSAEGGVDRHPGCFGNLLERHIAVEAHHENLSLVLGEGLDEAAHVVGDLLVNEHILDSALAQLLAVEKIGTALAGIGRHLVFALLLTIVVNDEIVGDARDPCRKLPAFGVAALAYGGDGLDERFLKDVVGKVFILYNIENVGEHTLLVTFEERVESLIFAFGISGHQLFVGELSQILHYYNFIG